MKKSDFNPIYQNTSTESKIIASLERIAQAFRVLLWQESKENSLTPVQIQILIFLRFHDKKKCKVSYLAEEFNMTKATISETVKILEQKQLITKIPESQDTRSYIIELTDKGRETAEKSSLFSEKIAGSLSDFSPEEKENLLSNLMSIIRNLNQAGIISIQRMCMNCTYYEYTESSQTHFCRLINEKLKAIDLRIDCPEHIEKTL